MSVFGKLVNTFLPYVPKALVGAVAQRYVAGESLDEALQCIDALSRQGALSTVDILGESVTDAEHAAGATQLYSRLIEALGDSRTNATVSVKPTMLGLNISPELCTANIDSLYAAAARYGLLITVDMEDSGTTDYTLDLYRSMEERHGLAGCVLQAYMRRTMADAGALPPGANVRLCKGIYVEPEEIAWKGYQEVRDNFAAVLEYLITSGRYPCIATHDEWLVDRALKLVAKYRLRPDQYEFQMLLGVKPHLRRRLIAAGHSLRVYVPYGSDWYAYSIRRLRENPQITIHVIRAMLGMK